MSQRFTAALGRIRHGEFHSLIRGLKCALILVAALLAMPSPLQAEQASRRVLHIDSYHKGNEWNDRIVEALRWTLHNRGVEVRVFHMDTKRHSSEDEIKASAFEAMRLVESFKPD